MSTPTFNCVINTVYQSWIDSKLFELDNHTDISTIPFHQIKNYLLSQAESDDLKHEMKIEIHDGFLVVDCPHASLSELNSPEIQTTDSNVLQTYVMNLLESLSDSQYNELYEHHSLNLNQVIDLDRDTLVQLIESYGE